MSDIKVTQLVSASSATKDDLFMVVQGGVSKKLSLTTMLKNLDSGDNIRINPSQNAVSTKISSKSKEHLFYIDGVNDKIGINTSTPTELLHISGGNIKIGSSTSDGILISSYEILSHPAGTIVENQPITILRETSAISVFGASTYTLGNGIDGQSKYIYIRSIDTAGSTATISVPNGAGFTQIVLDAVGESVYLQYIDTKWVCFSSRGAVLS